jgi:hypothetical protein
MHYVACIDANTISEKHSEVNKSVKLKSIDITDEEKHDKGYRNSGKIEPDFPIAPED